MGLKVEAIKYHTYNGKEYQVGDTYDAPDEQYVESVRLQGMAVPVDRAERAKAEQKAAEKAEKARVSGKTAVSPMGVAVESVKPAKVAKAPRARKSAKK